MRDVVITGIGLRTPIGHSLAEVQAAYRAGQSAIRAHTGPAGQSRAYAKIETDFAAGFSRAEQMTLGPLAQMAIPTAADAVRDCGADVSALDRNRAGVYLGSGQGTITELANVFQSMVGKDSVKAFTLLRNLGNSAANAISIRHGFHGASETFQMACTSSNAAIGAAFRSIRHGYLDMAIAGGAEQTFSEGMLRLWEAMRVLAKFDPEHPEQCCRPFSKNRTGLVLGEGAVFYVLEAEEHARARGARIYARISGYGTSCDATSIASPDASGQALAMTLTLKDAGLTPADIGYINAHGTATPAGDPEEVKGLRMALGSQAEQIPVSSTKSIHGHLLGAAGAIELLSVISVLQDGLMAPTMNLDEADPECDLDFVPNQAREGVSVSAAISSSFAFGGSNGCLLLTKA